MAKYRIVKRDDDNHFVIQGFETYSEALEALKKIESGEVIED